MKKVFPLFVLVLATLACGLPTDTPAPITTEPPVVTESPTEPPVMANVACNELSLYLDPAVGSSYSCETIPESVMEFEIHPQFTRITLGGYPLAGTFFSPRIDVYPVAAYTALMPDYIPGRVAALQGLTAGALPGTESLPFLPTFNAAQIFHARYQVVPFQNGSGIRFLTEYAQYFAPVNNHDLFYTYQGLTSDGRYWVSAILPINHPMLPANPDNPPGGQTWEQFANNYEPYITDMIAQLEAQAPESFIPSLTALDALAQSIIIQGMRPKAMANIINYLVRKGKAKVLSSPTVVAMNGQEATIASVDKINYKAYSTADEALNKQTDAGISLTITPTIGSETLSLAINAEVSSLVGWTSSGEPIINARSTTANVVLKDGELFTLSGLRKDTITKTDERVPVLGSIPLIGYVFRHEIDVKKTSEIVVLLTPRKVTATKGVMDKERELLQTTQGDINAP